MTTTARLLCFILFALLAIPARAEVPQRIALVIGNAAYRFAPLRNPIHDVRDMEIELQKLHFKVSRIENVASRSMRKAIDELSKASEQSSSVVLFYYAGHAIQYEGKNYLIPVDLAAASLSEVIEQSICLDSILASLEQRKENINIIIIDACRTNPHDTSDSIYSGQERSIRVITNELRNNGLAPMKGIAGTFIAFSTSPGKPASDGLSDNGLYTQYLLHYLASPAHTIEEIFKKVRVGVLRDSNQQQIPWERSSLLKDFYFIPPSEEKLTKKTVRDLLQEARVDIAGQRFGMAYKRLKLANKMAESEEDVREIQRLMKQIRSELGG